MKYPDSYNNLNYRQRCFVDCYINQNLVQPTLHRHTFNDEFASYVFAYQKDLACKEALELKFWTTDGFGVVHKAQNYVAGCKIEVVVKNMQKYMSLTKCARKVHGECTKAINDIRTIMYSSEDKSKELELKDAIYNSSLFGSDFKDRNENRKMMMKIMGLDQIKVDTSVDIYQASGKQILARLGSKGVLGGSEDEPVIPIDMEEIGEE